MKKLITFFAAISMLAVSCQKENIINDDKDTGITTGKLTATMMPKTKVSYTMMEYDDDWNWNYDYDEWDYEHGLLPAWEVGDKIIGFDDSGNTYTLTVASIDGDGIATLSGTVPDGNLHLIYQYGAQASDISDKTLAVDYTGQAGDKTMPAVMLADGLVEDGGCDFTFTNAGAVICVWFAEGLPLDSKVTQVELSGENLSGATIALDGGALTLTATPNDDDAILVDGLDLTVVDDDWGTVLSTPVWIAVPDRAVIEMVTLTVPTLIESTSMRIPGTTSDYVTIAGKKWAKWNIGANSEKEYGWYFAWGDTAGYFHDLDHWLYDGVVVDFKYSYYVPDEPYEASAGTHCLSGSDGDFQLEAQTTSTFDWENAPFNNGNTDTDNTYFSSIRNTVCPDDILASDYDAAHVNWGGTWRMPTRGDFISLINACGGAGGTCSPTPLASATPGQGIYWVSEVQTYIEDYTGVAGFLFCDGTSKLFFPAAGFGDGSALSYAGNNGYYWSSSLYPSTTAWGNAYCMSLSYYTAKTDFTIRRRGYPIRPVSD